MSEAVRDYEANKNRQDPTYQKALVYRYKQCLRISRTHFSEFPFGYAATDAATESFLTNYLTQPEYATENAEDRAALKKERIASTKIEGDIQEKFDLIDEEYRKINLSIPAIENHGLAAHSAKDLADLTALYQILVLSNQAVESDDNLLQDLRLQKQFLTEACLEKIKLGMRQPVALHQHFAFAKAMSAGPLADYLPACPAYPLVFVNDESAVTKPETTYFVTESGKLYQTDKDKKKRVFEGIDVSDTPTPKQIEQLDHELTSRGGYSIQERKLPALLKGVSQIQESPEELLQFNEKTQYAELLHILPCSFSMAVYFFCNMPTQLSRNSYKIFLDLETAL